MKLFSKLITVGVSICLVHVAYADSCSTPCPKEECPKPCPKQECPKPCPKEECPKPCPKPCPPKPCKPCPPVCFEPGYPTSPECMSCAYNTAACYELAPCPWNFWIDASFTYWQAYEEGLSFGLSTTEIAGQVQAPENGVFLFQDTSFKPGFKVGLGVDLDNDHWSGLLEYAWFRSKTTTRSDAPVDDRGGVAVWAGNNFLAGQNYTNIHSSWRCNMDLLDSLLTRPYYQGTHLIVAPFGGLRAQWIRQKLNLTGQAFSQSLLNPAVPVNIGIKSHSWGVGPKVGFQGEWHLGWGFRFEGDASASLLFTRYTRVSLDRSSPSDQINPASFRYRNYNTIRAGSELTLGFGWGSYFDCRNYHLDILATYDFQIFWNQNMMRHLADTFAGTGYSPANLYLQGLTLRTQFDF